MLLLDMLEGFFYNVSDVIVGKLIKYILADLLVFDKSVLPEYLELMRDSRLCHAEYTRNIANTHRRAIDGK